MALSVGVDVGGTKVLAMAIDEDGTRVGAEVRRPTPSGADALIDTIAGVIGEVRASAGDVVAVGLGVPGLVDRDGRLTVGPNLPGVSSVPFRAVLESRLDLPVSVDNDATCATWAEVRFGAARGETEAFLVTLGTGIGGGFVTGGVLQRGEHGFAGEPGHMVVDPDGPDCPCGRRGCWERFASGSGLGRLAQEAVAEGRGARLVELAGGTGSVRGEHVTVAAQEGDADALAIMERFGWWAALGIANLVNVFDPAVVVVGGGLVESGDVVLAPIRAAFGDLVLAAAHRPKVPILPAELGGDAGAIGAALIGFERAR